MGLSIALQNLALVLWTADAQFVRTDYYTVVVRLGSAVLNVAQIVAFAVAVLFTAALFAFMRWSYTGKVMRATAQDRHAASLMGIDTGRVFALTWTVGITCVGVAGILLAPVYPVYPTAGLQFVLIAYVAVVLGGLGDMVSLAIHLEVERAGRRDAGREQPSDRRGVAVGKGAGDAPRHYGELAKLAGAEPTYQSHSVEEARQRHRAK